jgi:hypothetical protein
MAVGVVFYIVFRSMGLDLLLALAFTAVAVVVLLKLYKGPKAEEERGSVRHGRQH